MASRLDSTPQSPESSHNTIRMDQTPPTTIGNTTITDLGADSTPTENGPDETTLLLLNEQNSPHTGNHHSQVENRIWQPPLVPALHTPTLAHVHYYARLYAEEGGDCVWVCVFVWVGMQAQADEAQRVKPRSYCVNMQRLNTHTIAHTQSKHTLMSQNILTVRKGWTGYLRP